MKEKQDMKEIGFKICMLDKSFVFIGRLFETETDYWIKGGACIRSWGTTQGIGQIAYDGPTVETKLDPIPNFRYPKGQFIIIIDVHNPEKWSFRTTK